MSLSGCPASKNHESRFDIAQRRLINMPVLEGRADRGALSRLGIDGKRPAGSLGCRGQQRQVPYPPCAWSAW